MVRPSGDRRSGRNGSDHGTLECPSQDRSRLPPRSCPVLGRGRLRLLGNTARTRHFCTGGNPPAQASNCCKTVRDPLAASCHRRCTLPPSSCSSPASFPLNPSMRARSYRAPSSVPLTNQGPVYLGTCARGKTMATIRGSNWPEAQKFPPAGTVKSTSASFPKSFLHL